MECLVKSVFEEMWKATRVQLHVKQPYPNPKKELCFCLCHWQKWPPSWVPSKSSYHVLPISRCSGTFLPLFRKHCRMVSFVLCKLQGLQDVFFFLCKLHRLQDDFFFSFANFTRRYYYYLKRKEWKGHRYPWYPWQFLSWVDWSVCSSNCCQLLSILGFWVVTLLNREEDQWQQQSWSKSQWTRTDQEFESAPRKHRQQKAWAAESVIKKFINLVSWSETTTQKSGEKLLKKELVGNVMWFFAER